MESTRLIHKANQISDYFKAYPEDEAIAAVANHIWQFWDPRMRAQLADHIETSGDGLNPLSLAAARLLSEKTKSSS
ncbi:MAG: formate dehydrogenase subunit delta [Alphaproteobacteria bacterium]|nr:formate dehydrogenase subunit delta [Alphaproteobacteria bacterium]